MYWDKVVAAKSLLMVLHISLIKLLEIEVLTDTRCSINSYCQAG
jgi:hypothetical protein